MWAAGAAVAVGAAVATAHGLYETAVAARVPAGIAWMYPLITDGLALVAYAATTRLRTGAARYAWAVVVLAAGLSGLAQAAYLAADPASSGGPGALLRFGIGAWPAVAAAVTAHLLYLLAEAPAEGQPATARPDPAAPVDTSPSTAPGEGSPAVPDRSGPRPIGSADQPGRAGANCVPADQSAPRPPAPDRSATVTALISRSDPGTHTAISTHPPRPEPPGPDTAEPRSTGSTATAAEPQSPRERAETEATRQHADTGAWPSVRALAAAADVSYGTAQTVLADLRDPTTNQTATPEDS